MKSESSILERIGTSALFVLSFGFQPLFSSNQNTKFLHGVAQTGDSQLQADWMANTIDPLPVFSTLIGWIFESGQPWLIYALQATLIFVYAFYSLTIANEVFSKKTHSNMLLFSVFFFLIHSPILFADIFWGFSGQYLFVQYLQPSSFAVLYIPAIYYFLQRKYWLSALLMGVPGLFHAAYTLVGATIFISSFSYLLFKEKKLFPIIGYGLLFSVVMMPAVITQLTLLQSTSEGLTNEAMRIISEYRIPHHTKVLSIFRFDFVIKVAAIVLSIFLLRHRQLKWVLACLSLLLFLAIGYGWLSKNSIVSVSTPWRFSVLVVPLAFTLLSAILAEKINTFLPKQSGFLSLLLLIFFFVSGCLWTKKEYDAYLQEAGMKALRWVKENKSEFSNATFLVESDAIYAERFRLETGLPIYINWKTHPYKDVEVIEWFERHQQNEAFYNQKLSLEEQAAFFAKNNITHVVLPSDSFMLNSPIVFEDEELKIYTVADSQSKN